MHNVCPAGSLPAVYSALRNLTLLRVGSNSLTGTSICLSVCTTWGGLGSHARGHAGPLPSEWSSLQKLETLKMAFNNISGASVYTALRCQSLGVCFVFV